jgi:hypothetical protein
MRFGRVSSEHVRARQHDLRIAINYTGGSYAHSKAETVRETSEKAT